MYRCLTIKIKTRTMMMTIARDHGNDYSDAEYKNDEDVEAVLRMPR